MIKVSAGILVYRRKNSGVEILLVHPGGPFWSKKDAASWSVPKGMCDPGEELLDAAHREFTEETGFTVPHGQTIDLGSVKYGDKRVNVWAVEGDLDAKAIKSAFITVDWPPGKQTQFPECDKAAWFDPQTAAYKIVKGQLPFIERLTDSVR